MSRRRIAAPATIGLAIGIVFASALSVPAAAQDGATGSPPERIDLTLPRPLRSTEEECRRRTESASISGEIVVCATIPREDQRITSREDSQRRYAEATMGRSTPDVAGPGIFRGPATVGGICVPGIFNCPKPAAVFVDVTALPKAPPGSDADRISRGLAPLGESRAVAGASQRPLTAQERAELGIPAPLADSVPQASPPPDAPTAPAPVSPSGSEAPAAPQ